MCLVLWELVHFRNFIFKQSTVSHTGAVLYAVDRHRKCEYGGLLPSPPPYSLSPPLSDRFVSLHTPPSPQLAPPPPTLACIRMKRLYALLGRGGAAATPKVMLPTSDPEVFHLPHVDGVKGMVGYAHAARPQGKAAAGRVVCVHGCPGSIRDFRYLAHHLEAAGHEVLRLDLPGHGKSLKAEVAGHLPDCEAMARAACSSMEDVFGSDGGVLLVSHSLGSHVALEMLRQNPARFSGLCLICPAGLSPHNSLQPWPLIRGVASSFLTAPGQAPSLLSRLVSYVLPLGYKMRGFPPLPMSELQLCQRRLALIDFDRVSDVVIPDVLRTTTFPICVAYATDDRVCNKEVVEGLVDRLQGVTSELRTRSDASIRVLAFSEGGHAVQKFKAKEIADAILALKN